MAARRISPTWASSRAPLATVPVLRLAQRPRSALVATVRALYVLHATAHTTHNRPDWLTVRLFAGANRTRLHPDRHAVPTVRRRGHHHLGPVRHVQGSGHHLGQPKNSSQDPSGRGRRRQHSSRRPGRRWHEGRQAWQPLPPRARTWLSSLGVFLTIEHFYTELSRVFFFRRSRRTRCSSATASTSTRTFP